MSASAAFKRSPSKVWWGSESVEWRESSDSPAGSQDSGFSDSELGLLRSSSGAGKNKSESPKNLTANCVEKTTPAKLKFPSKINRNLFKSHEDQNKNNLYSKGDLVTCNDDKKDQVGLNQSTPALRQQRSEATVKLLNKSAPPTLLHEFREEEEDILTHFNNHSLSSDCESELECLFEAPRHTSTPMKPNKMTINLFQKYHHERVPPLNLDEFDNESVKKWLQALKIQHEVECMTALQSKSILADLNQRINQRAVIITSTMSNLITASKMIECEFKNLNNEDRQILPLAQSLAGNIKSFVQNFDNPAPNSALFVKYDRIKSTTNTAELLTLLCELFDLYQDYRDEILSREIFKLVEKLEKPCSELGLRATVTGVTSLCLTNASLVEAFVKNDAIPILLILSEKCDGSSVRSQIFRLLATLCCDSYAVRQLEKYSGIYTIVECLSEQSRPEPEKSEAVALLAQITAPWIEDNHSVKGLGEFSERLVASLTHFAKTTKCCQNLLLCVAALANLSAMHPECIPHMLHRKTMESLLDAVQARASYASIYLLEQLATVMANVSASNVGKRALIKCAAIPALVSFLNCQNGGGNPDVAMRLQQKTIVALSRLCGDQEGAQQLVELRGVEKLVALCKNKEERFDNDAVLVASLATLRKIVDCCGSDVARTEDVQELVKPKLLDSFLAYSSQNESYV